MRTTANDIVIRVTSRNDAKAGMDAARADVDKLQVRAKALGDEFARTSRMTDDFGRRMNAGSTFADFLSKKITTLREETARLGQEFNRTGDTSLLSRVFDNNTALKDMEKIKAELKKTLGDAGQQGGQDLTKNLQSTFSIAAPGLMPVLVGSLVALAPMIGAAINAAVLLGVAGGGLAAGVIGQLHDPGVQAAAKDFGRSLMGELTRDTSSFAKPIEDALATIGGSLQGLIRSSGLSGLADLIGPLSRGIAGMITELGPGLRAAFAAARPLIGELERDLPQIGQAISFMFEQMSKGSNGAVLGLRSLVAVLIGSLEVTGVLVRGLSDFYEWLVKAEDAVSGFYDRLAKGLGESWSFFDLLGRITGRIHEAAHNFADTTPQVDQLGRSFTAAGADAQLTADDLKSLSAQIAATAITTDTLAGQMSDKLFSALVSGDQAMLGLHKTALALSDTLAKNGLAIDRHTHLVSLDTQQGLANRDAVLARIEANIKQYDSDIAAGVAAGDAAASYDANTAALDRQLRKAGFTAAQVDDLIGKYRNVPDKVDTEIATKGLTAAIDDLATLLSLINHIQTQRQINIDITNRINAPGNFGHASGGVAGGWTTVNEQGGELMRLPQGTMVYSRPDTERMLAQSQQAGSPAAGGFRHELIVAGNADSLTGTFLMNLMRNGAFSIQSRYVVN